MVAQRLLHAFGLAILLATAAGAASARDRIRILCPTWSGFMPVFVAQDLGYFKALDLDVSIRFEDERSNVMAAMARGDIEIDMRSIGEYQGRPRDAGTPGVIIGAIDESVGGDGVVADGAIGAVADLKGRSVASEINIPGRLLLQLALKQAGLSLSDVRMKEIATADSVSTFADHSIAAVATYEPFLSQSLKNNPGRAPKILVSSSQYPGLIVDGIIVRQDDLAANPDKYRRFLIGVYKAIAYFNADPDGFVRLAAPHLKLSPADFRASIDGSLVYTGLDRSAGYFGKPGAPGTLYGVFDTVMQLNLENGAADHRLDAAASIDNTVIATISAADLQ
jgi:NitT/TauT family transport system substrate-binding protein